MTRYHRNVIKKKFTLLFIIIFHVLAVIVSAYYDKGIKQKEYGSIVRLDNIKYWLWFFTWWSAWASLLSVPWAVYKLFVHEKKKNTFGEQIINLVVTETNLISGIVYCLGGFFLTLPAKPQQMIPYPFLGEAKTIYVYCFYNLFWHILAPLLVFYYFWKHCSVDKLKKNKKASLVANLINPTFYYCYIMVRPLIANSKPESAKPHFHPRDYPYPPFFWSVGAFASKKEEMSSNKFFFWHNWPSWIQSLFWVATIFTFCYLTFSLLAYFLIKIKANHCQVFKQNSWSKHKSFKN